MNPNNRWIKIADSIPWEQFERKYARLFKDKNGNVAKPLRLALGSLIIQTKYQYSDRELVNQLTQNRLIRTKLKETTLTSIALSVFVTNLF